MCTGIGSATYIDTHVHLDDQRYAGDLHQVLADARADGVRWMICPGCDVATSKRAMGIAEREDGIYCAVGIHPHEAESDVGDFYKWARGLKGAPKLVAVGEIGLDYFYDHAPKEAQREVFAEQLGLAQELGLPVIIHDRDAHGDTLELLRSGRPSAGVLHCFSGSWETAKLCLDMGFYISFAGAVTFKNAARLREVASKVPVHRLLSETDGPYLTPEPFRGRRNEPRHVVRIVECLAGLHGIGVDEMAAATLQNAGLLFGIPTSGAIHL